MKLEIARPYLLLLIPLAVIFIIYTSKYMGKMFKARKRMIVVVRNIVLILLILALSGFSIRWKVDETSTIFLIDCSDSMKDYIGEAENFVKEAISEKGNKDIIGVMTFGDEALIENFVTKNTVFDRIQSKPLGTYTNIKNAIEAAISVMPENTKKRIVVLTDGEENKQTCSKTADSLVEQGIDFKVYKVNKEQKNEVAVDSVIVPKVLSKDEEFNVVINISSTVNTEASLILFSDKEKSAVENVNITKGKNTFVFKDKAENGGFRSYRVLIQPKIDNLVENNEGSAFTNIKAKPKILVIEDDEGEADELVKILQGSNMDYNRINAGSTPKALTTLSKYKTIITCDVSAENLSDDFLNNLETYVKDLGGGFIATGGNDSFALGGYYKTPLEDILPVDMDMKGKKEIPSMSMVLIIDKSGSMGSGAAGYSKMELAKEAAIRTLDSLRPNKDEIGVLAFDGKNYWVVERDVIDNKKSIENSIGTIRADGGTSIIPALQEGFDSLRNSKAGIKHVILLTDGQAEQSGYEELIKDFKEEGITISTVAVGAESDTQLLENIAQKANGRFYYTEDSSTIPKIFAKETYMVTRSYINNREFTPIISSYHPILSGLSEEGLPTLLGYIGASPKKTSKVLLKSDDDDPILTVWQYGLGKTAAWNSDIKGKWNANYIGWNNNMKLWQNIINFTVEDFSNNDNTYVKINMDGEKGKVEVNSDNFEEGISSSATIITPSLQNLNIELYPTEPGKFLGEFEIKEKGVYLIKGVQSKDGEVITAVNGGLSVQYSPEYKINPKTSSLDILISAASGTYIEKPLEVYKGKIKEISKNTDISTFLLVLALIIFVIDIAIRRINFPFYKLKIKLQQLTDKLSFMKKKIRKNKNDTIEQAAFTEKMKSSINKTSTAEIKVNKVNENKETANNSEDITIKKDKYTNKKDKNTKRKEKAAETSSKGLDTSSLLKARDKRNKHSN